MRYLSIAAGQAVLAALVCVLAACHGEPPPAPPVGQPLAAAENAGAEQDAGSWGSVKGQIVWGGNGLPEAKKLDVNKDQAHCLSRGDILSEEWIVNKDNKGIRWVVVWLIPDPPPDPEKNPDAKLAVHPSLKEVPKMPVEIDQPRCKFEPHVVALRQGQVLAAKNSSPIVHNVNWAGIRNRGDNKLVPATKKIDIDDLKASPFPVIIQCNIHPWMKAYARIFDHPYFAVTDADGRFEIKNAPAGKCRIVIWHENGFRTDKDGEPIEIKANAATDLGKRDLKPR